MISDVLDMKVLSEQRRAIRWVSFVEWFSWPGYVLCCLFSNYKAVTEVMLSLQHVLLF